MKSNKTIGIGLIFVGTILLIPFDNSWGLIGIVLGSLIFSEGWQFLNITGGHYIPPECKHCILKSFLGLLILISIPIPIWLIQEEGILITLSIIYAVTCLIWGMNWLTSYFDCISDLPSGAKKKL